jgi:cell division protein FtsL
MDPIKIVSEMVGVRQDIQELSRRIEERTMKMDRLIDDLVEWMKHKRIIETRKVKSQEG